MPRFHQSCSLSAPCQGVSVAQTAEAESVRRRTEAKRTTRASASSESSRSQGRGKLEYKGGPALIWQGQRWQHGPLHFVLADTPKKGGQSQKPSGACLQPGSPRAAERSRACKEQLLWRLQRERCSAASDTKERARERAVRALAFSRLRAVPSPLSRCPTLLTKRTSREGHCRSVRSRELKARGWCAVWFRPLSLRAAFRRNSPHSGRFGGSDLMACQRRANGKGKSAGKR